MAKPRRDIHTNATNNIKIATEPIETSIGKIEIPSISSKTTTPIPSIQTKTIPIQTEFIPSSIDFLEYKTTGQIVSLTKENTVFNWKELNKQVDAIFIDLNNEEKIKYCQSQKIPFIVYIDIPDLNVETKDISKLLKKYSISACAFSIAVQDTKIRLLLIEYIKALRADGIENIGLLMNDITYAAIGPDISQIDFIWLSHYGPGSPKYPCHFHAFTNEGRLKGVDGNIILTKASPNSKKTTQWLREIAN